MINAVHGLIYTKKAEEVRAFLRDVIEWPHVDAGDGWLLFALPPAELGVHPTDDDDAEGSFELYLMCDDVEKTVVELKRKGIEITQPIADRGWGLVTALRLPGGSELGLYQPKHPVAARLAAR